MANRQTNLDVNITANDQASRVIGKIADDARQLEDGIEVDVDVQDDASDELRDIRSKLEQLSDEDKVIALRANASQLESEIRRAERSLKDLAKYDGDEIAVRISARDQASRKLDAIQAELRDLEGETATVRVESRGLDDVTGSFRELAGGGASAGGLAALGKGGLIGGAAYGAKELADAFANAAIEAQVLADLTGAQVQDASALLAVWKDNGLEANDLLDILLQMNATLLDSPELAAELGVNMNDGKDATERFLEVVGNLQTEIDDAGRRGVVSSQLFGEEGVRQVGRVVTVVGDLQAAVEDVPEARIIDPAAVERAREYNAEMVKLRGYYEQLKILAGGAFAGGANRVISGDLGISDLPFAIGSDIGSSLFGGGGGSRPSSSARGIAADLADRRDALAAATINIINPAGTPATTAEDLRFYNLRNGR